MSVALRADIPSTVTAALNKIEEGSKDLSEKTQRFAIGPFSVFNGASSPEFQGTPQSITATISPVENTFSPGLESVFPVSTATVIPNPPFYESGIGARDNGQDYVSHEQSGLLEFGFNKSENLSDLLSSSIDFLQWGDLFTWDTDAFGHLAGFSTASSQLEGCHFSTAEGLRPDTAEVSTVLQNRQADVVGEDIAWPQIDLVGDAPMLLRHFNDEVINQMGSLPINEKSAWRILNFPSTIITLSQLTSLDMRDEIRHANLANFYAVVAVSALHLSFNSANFPSLSRPVGHWSALAKRTYKAAKHHLKISLDVESRQPHKAKYKEQLMAIGAILASAVSQTPLFQRPLS